MNGDTDALMVEATRLTRAGRLAEATALIQRSLGGTRAPTGNSADQASESRPIDVTYQVGTDPTTSVASPPSAAKRGSEPPRVRSVLASSRAGRAAQ